MENEAIKNYIDLVVGDVAKQFGAITLDAVRLLTIQQLNESMLTFEEVKNRTRASGTLILEWLQEGKLHPILYPDQELPHFDRVEVDRLVLQYVVPVNETILRKFQQMERDARKKIS